MPKDRLSHDIGIYMMTHGPECIYSQNYIIPMDLGAEHRNNCRYSIRDNIGDDTISEKNDLYNEITGLYWMWKYSPYKIIGLCHYRRVFPLSERKIRKLLKKIDIIMPRQYWYDLYPSMKEHFCRHHSKSDWKVMEAVLKEMYPEYAKSAEKVFNDHFIFGLNMFITRKELMDTYCEWLFPLLFQIEKKININDGRSEYDKRSIGILSERLFTLYILHNVYQKKIKITKKLVLDIHEHFPQIVSKNLPRIIVKQINSSNRLSSLYRYRLRIKKGFQIKKQYKQLGN